MKTNMKKMFLALNLCLILAGTTLTPNSANAILIVMGIPLAINSLINPPPPDTRSPEVKAKDDMDFTIKCLLLLPFCLYDKQSNLQEVLAKSLLLDNGYNPNEADLIIKDQAQLTLNLTQQHKLLKVQKTDTGASIASDVRSVYPAVSQVYLEYLKENLNLN